MLYVRYVHLTKAKQIPKSQIHPLVREDVILGQLTARVQLQKKISDRGSQGIWRRDELIGGKQPVVSNFDFDVD
jgi:hypothetical protein